MSTEKKFSDTGGRDDMLEVEVWSGDRGDKVFIFAQSNDGGRWACVTVDAHEFKAWLDQAYAEALGQHESNPNASDRKDEK